MCKSPLQVQGEEEKKRVKTHPNWRQCAPGTVPSRSSRGRHGSPPISRASAAGCKTARLSCPPSRSFSTQRLPDTGGEGGGRVEKNRSAREERKRVETRTPGERNDDGDEKSWLALCREKKRKTALCAHPQRAWPDPSPEGTFPRTSFLRRNRRPLRSNSSAGEGAKEGTVDSCPRLEEPLLSTGALVRRRVEY